MTEDDLYGDEEEGWGEDAEEESEAERVTPDEEQDENFLEWYDSQGNYHEIEYGDPPEDSGEIRTTFQTYEEAKDYLFSILYGADQFFDIYYTENGYEVWYLGGSE